MKIFLNHRQMQQCLIHPSLGDPICLTANTVIDVDDMLAYRMMFFIEIILAVSLEQRRQLFHKQIFHCLSQFIPLFNRNFPLERYSSAKIQISPFSSLVNNILLAFSLNYLVLEYYREELNGLARFLKAASSFLKEKLDVEKLIQTWIVLSFDQMTAKESEAPEENRLQLKYSEDDIAELTGLKSTKPKTNRININVHL